MSEVANPVMVLLDSSWPYAARWVEQALTSHSAPCAYVDMNGIAEQSQPDYARVPILNRPEHIMTFQGVSNREISLVFHYLAEGASSYEFTPGKSSPTESSEASSLRVTADIISSIRRAVISPALWLDSLKYPYVEAGTGVTHAPPPVYLTIGGLLRLRCVVTSCVITWRGPWYYTSALASDALPMQADVAVTFTSVASASAPIGVNVSDAYRSGNGSIPRG